MIPSVVMIATNNPLIRHAGAFQASDDVVGCHHLPVEFKLEPDPRGPGSQVVGYRQAATPFLRNYRSAHRLEQGQSISIGYWQHRNLGNSRRFFAAKSIHISSRTDTGSEHIAWIGWHIHNRATLYAAIVLVGTFGIYIAWPIAVVSWVGIDESANCTHLSSELGLDATPGSPIF